MMSTQSTLRSPFLDLPLELRLLIFNYAIVESDSVTISSAQLTGAAPDIVHRLYGDGRVPLAGLPLHHEPVILSGYSSHLLSASDPARIHVSRAAAPGGLRYLDPAWQTTQSALRLVNHQLNDELYAHFKSKSSRDTSLFVSYPHGLNVFQTMCPDMIRQAKSLHIAGTYNSTYRRQAQPPVDAPITPPQSPKSKAMAFAVPDAVEQLTNLIHSTMGPDPTSALSKLEMRIYFPNPCDGQDSYYSVWGDDNSPICIVLRNICGGFIDMECWRGRNGTGVHLSVRPNPDKSRVISTVWRRLKEGAKGQPKTGDFVVDPNWPEWSEEWVPSPQTP